MLIPRLPLKQDMNRKQRDYKYNFESHSDYMDYEVQSSDSFLYWL